MRKYVIVFKDGNKLQCITSDEIDEIDPATGKALSAYVEHLAEYVIAAQAQAEYIASSVTGKKSQ